MGFFSELFGRGKEVSVSAERIHINISNEKQFKRNVSRLITLYNAVSQGDNRQEVREEMEERKDVFVKFGHKRPESLEDVVKINEELK